VQRISHVADSISNPASLSTGYLARRFAGRPGYWLWLLVALITVKNDASCSRLPLTATRNMARAIPLSVERTSGRR
jgi:beta-lactamase regulating signal transducer with metallopeptidase domain